jgi:DNA repair exonuclease SbcCD ATPase subunit
MNGKTQDLGGVIKMIDDMVVLLGKDQADDDKSKTYCQDEFEKSADEETAAKEKLASTEAKISELEDTVAQLAEEIEVLQGEIKGLDKAVAEATEQRKEEHANFGTTTELSEAAIQLLGKAKNRLQKFYNPTLYKAPPKTEMTMEEKIVDAGTFAQIHAHRDVDDEAPSFAQYKKSEKSAGVLGLMDMMVSELESDMKDASYEEKTAAKDYAALMGDSQATRAQDSKSIIDKTASKAEVGEKLTLAKESKTASEKDVALIGQVISDLHVSCDFLLQNYDLRKEARTNEVESLKNAKAILSGASFGF